MNRYKILLVLILFPVITINLSCSKFLEIKPDKKLVTPSTSVDLLAMMNSVNNTNYSYITGVGEMASDNVLVFEDTWTELLGPFESSISPYIWRKLPVSNNFWDAAYRKVLQSNMVIDLIDQVDHSSDDVRDNILGMAYFVRGFSFYELTQIYSVPYNHESAKEKLGIVLRLNPDINEVSKRSNLQESYDQVISDLTNAANLLSHQKPLYPTRPYKVSAFSLLARCYLSMGEYELAGNYADSALMIQSDLLNYNEVQNKEFPFDRFNEEVLFFSQMAAGIILNNENSRVDSNLMKLYSNNDLRGGLFYTQKNDGYFSFTGDYSQQETATFFNGPTTAEMFLIRAECSIRLGNLEQGLADISKFQANRYKNYTNQKLQTLNSTQLLDETLLERRKELVFRGLRWSDLRRLNEETPQRIVKKLGNQLYVLETYDIKNFAFLIPQYVIDFSTIEQN